MLFGTFVGYVHGNPKIVDGEYGRYFEFRFKAPMYGGKDKRQTLFCDGKIWGKKIEYAEKVIVEGAAITVLGEMSNIRTFGAEGAEPMFAASVNVSSYSVPSERKINETAVMAAIKSANLTDDIPF